MDRCKICINKSECGSCDKKWKDKFIPNENARSYFSSGYVGTMGIDGRIWTFNTTNEKLIPTKSVVIDGSHYCAYCCEPMFTIQDDKTLDRIGNCCICDGGVAELEYGKKLEELKSKHSEELMKLSKEHRDKLKINTARLFEIKQEMDKKNFEFFNRENESTIYIKENEIDIKELTFGVRYE